MGQARKTTTRENVEQQTTRYKHSWAFATISLFIPAKSCAIPKKPGQNATYHRSFINKILYIYRHFAVARSLLGFKQGSGRPIFAAMATGGIPFCLKP